METSIPAPIVLEAGQVERHYWRDLWRYRQLFFFLAWRDVLVRYKQTVIGAAWALIRPFLTMVVFTVIFGKLAKMPDDGVPYPILVFAGMLPWQFFAAMLGESANSLVANSNLISKVYFPRMIVPLGSVVTAAVDFSISLLMLGALFIWYGFTPGWSMLALPGFLVLAVLAAIGPGLLITALNVKYRDFRYVVPFLVQFGLYASPVGFSSSVVPEQWRLLYSLNPMVGVIDGFRWCVTGNSQAWHLPGFLASLAVVAIFLWAGVAYFRRMERTFADVI